MAECKVKSTRLKCNCTYKPCERKGICCECLPYHWKMKELPACFFPDNIERTYDRSLKNFLRVWGK